MAALFNSKILNFLSIVLNHHNIVSNITENVMNINKNIDQIVQHIHIFNNDVRSDLNERYMNSSELVRYHGYTAEEYTVESGSGYLLNLVRVQRPGSPVLLVHGLTGSSDTFLTSGKKSLAFLLADANYDVWLLNVRGNLYSLKHTLLLPSEPAFWKFSFHEIGTEDVPAAVDFILGKTKWVKLAYVGHSQGTTAAYIMLSLHATYNDKLSVVISLAPIAWTSHMLSPLPHLFAKFRVPLQLACESLGIYQFMPNNVLTDILTKDILGSSPVFSAIFENFWFWLWGFSVKTVNYQNVQNQIGHFFGGSSMYQVYHYLQGIESGYFREYDFGPAKNMQVYGSSAPPEYPVTKITCKMFFFYSENDWLSSYEDFRKLQAQVQNIIGEQNLVGFNHIDYCWARDASAECYSQLIKVIQRVNHV